MTVIEQLAVPVFCRISCCIFYTAALNTTPFLLLRAFL